MYSVKNKFMSPKSKIILIVAVIIVIVLLIFSLALYFYFKTMKKLSVQPPKPPQLAISSSQQLGDILSPSLAQILPPDFGKFSFQILQNEKREISDGSIQYVFSYLDYSRTLPQIYAYYRYYLKTNAELSIDRLYKDNFLLEAKSSEASYHFIGSLADKGNTVTLSWIEK